MAAIIDREVGELVAAPGLDQFAEWQARLRGSDTGADGNAVAAHALFDWWKRRGSSGKVVIRTEEAVALFKSVEIDIDLARTKPLLRSLGGRNGAAWRDGKTIRGYVFDLPDLQDLVDRHPLPGEVDPCTE